MDSRRWRRTPRVERARPGTCHCARWPPPSERGRRAAMSDPRAHSITGPAIDDLRALADVSTRDVPTVEQSVMAARAHRDRATARRRVSVALAILAATGLLIAPLPYQGATGSLYAFARDYI